VRTLLRAVLFRVKDRHIQIGIPTRRTIRTFIAFEAATFAIAALVHAGVLTTVDLHAQAATGESVIAIGLLIGLALTWSGLAAVATIGIVVQAFALLGTLVGIFTIAVGVGPRTVPDVGYHLAISAVLIAGLVVAGRRLA